MSKVIWERDKSDFERPIKRYEAQRLEWHGNWKTICETRWLWVAKWNALGWGDPSKDVRIIDHKEAA